MNRRIWGIIIIILALALIAIIIYFIFFFKFTTPAPVVVEPLVPQTQVIEQTPVVEPVKTEPALPLKKAEVKQDDLARMASAFAERFGSFSNQSDYGNIRDLEIFMTDTMEKWAENYINDARMRKADTSIYYGIITKSISSVVNKYDADTGQAEILVKTQRRESAGVSSNSSTFYQDIIIRYLKERGAWRVDGATWQNR
jgi:hypothetical protein